MSNLGENLKAAREKRGWTKKLVAQKLGLKQMSTYANYEYGLRDPDTEMLVKLAQVFEVTLDELTGNKGEVIEDWNFLDSEDPGAPHSRQREIYVERLKKYIEPLSAEEKKEIMRILISDL